MKLNDHGGCALKIAVGIITSLLLVSTTSATQISIPRIGMLSTWNSGDFSLIVTSSNQVLDQMRMTQGTQWYPNYVYANSTYSNYDLITLTWDAQATEDSRRNTIIQNLYDAYNGSTALYVNGISLRKYQNNTNIYNYPNCDNNKLFCIISDNGQINVFHQKTLGNNLSLHWNTSLVAELGINTTDVELDYNLTKWNNSNINMYQNMNNSKVDVLLQLYDNSTIYNVTVITKNKKAIFDYYSSAMPQNYHIFRQYFQALINKGNVSNTPPLHYNFNGYDNAIIITSDDYPASSKVTNMSWFYQHNTPFTAFTFGGGDAGIFNSSEKYGGVDVNLHSFNHSSWRSNANNYTYAELDALSLINLINNKYEFQKDTWLWRSPGYVIGQSPNLSANITNITARSNYVYAISTLPVNLGYGITTSSLNSHADDGTVDYIVQPDDIAIGGNDQDRYNWWAGNITRISDYYQPYIINDHQLGLGSQWIVSNYSLNRSFMSLTDYDKYVKSIWNISISWDGTNTITVKNNGAISTLPVGISLNQTIANVSINGNDYINFNGKSLIIPALSGSQSINIIVYFGTPVRNIIKMSHNIRILNISNNILSLQNALSNPYSTVNGSFNISGENNIYSGVNNNVSTKFNNISLSFVNATTINKLNMSVIPSSDYVNVAVIQWNTSSDYHIVWTESSLSPNVTTQHIIGDFFPNTNITINRDSKAYTTVTTNATGYINWTYSGGYSEGNSEHQFEILSSTASGPIIFSDDWNSDSIENYTATKGTWAVNTTTGQLYNSVYAKNARIYYKKANFSKARYTAIINVSGFAESIGFEYGGAYSVKLYPYGIGKIYLTRLSDGYNLMIDEMGYQAGHTYRIDVSWNPNNGVHIINLTEPSNSSYKYIYYVYDISSTSAGQFAFTMNTNNNSRFDYVEVNDVLDYFQPYPTQYTITNVNSIMNSNLNLSIINQTSIKHGYYYNIFLGNMNGNIYAISQDSCNLMQSFDIGNTWSSVYNFCTSNGVSIGTISTNSAVLTNGDYIFVETNNSKLYRSGLNDPTKWNIVANLSGSSPQIKQWSWYCTIDGWCILGEYGYKGVVYSNYHAYLSKDYGATWSMVFNGTLMGPDNTNMHVHQVYIDSAKRIYVALGDSPNMIVFMSNNNGTTYTKLYTDGVGTLAATELNDGRILFGTEDGSIMIYNPISTLTQKFKDYSNFFHDFVSGPQDLVPYLGRHTRYLSYFYKDPNTNIIYVSTSSSDADYDSSIYVTLNGVDFYEMVRFTNLSSSGSNGGHSFGAITSVGDYIIVPAGNMPAYRIKKLTVPEVLQLANGNNEVISLTNITKNTSYQSGVNNGIIGFTDAIIKNPVVAISSYNISNIITNPEFMTDFTGWTNDSGWTYDSTQGNHALGSAFLNTSLGRGNLSQNITSSFNSMLGSIGYYKIWFKSQRISGTASIWINVIYSDGINERFSGSKISSTATTWTPRYYQFSVRKNKTLSSVYLNITSDTYQGTINIDDVVIWKALYDPGRYTDGIFNTSYVSQGIYVDVEGIQYNSSNADINIGLSGLYDRINITNITVVSGSQKLNVSATGVIVAQGNNIILTTDKTNINIDTIYSNPKIEIYQNVPIDLRTGIVYNLSNTSGTIGSMIIMPSSLDNLISISFSTWNTTGNYRKVWNESSSNPSVTTRHIIGDFPPNIEIQINQDGIEYAIVTSNATGYIDWNHSGIYSEHQFEALPRTNSFFPQIIFWGNNQTNDDSLSVIIEKGDTKQFNVTANQNMTNWYWSNVTIISGNGTTDSNASRVWGMVGTFYPSVYGTNSNNNTNNTTWTVTIQDTTPPSIITNLTNISYDSTYINWTWTNPQDIDFYKVMIYLDGIFKTNASNSTHYYNATGLTTGSTHTIATRALDIYGNANLTWANHTATTSALPPPEAPLITGFTLDTNGTKGNWIKASVNITNSGSSSQWFVINVSGTNNVDGYPLAATATVRLGAGESLDSIPVLITVSPNASTGTYSLIAGIWKFEDFANPDKLITTRGPQNVIIS